QAEDGIRDRNVTGVQTCALPILEMFQNAEFWQATWNTIFFCILTVPVGIFLALLVAVLLNSKIRGRTTYRAIFFLPMVVAPAAEIGRASRRESAWSTVVNDAAQG